ncbi:MAG: DNA primase [Chlamydiales bacterium]|nr:DNA primase [Chlamydiales bacterium]
MVAYTQESLQNLRDKINLIEVISSYIPLKRSGSSHKALCPFHNEKNPSFLVQQGEKHYHCFGCGAHGDAIAFLMNYLNMSFVEAIDTLAEKYDVILEKMEGKQDKPSKNTQGLKDVLNKISRFYHFYLLHTQEGHVALEYLYKRGMDLSFIRMFQIGFAPKDDKVFWKVVQEYSITEEQLFDCGLIKIDPQRKTFFHDRVTIPIHDSVGNVIGFSCRKISDQILGPKYINTPETPLFKKSKILFGLRDCRRTIAKEKKVIVVEGQIDTLRLIQEGYDYVLSAGGTAFGEEHVKELIYLGVQKAYVAFDGDTAGINAAVKTGQLLQKKGIEVFVLVFDKDEDPDSILLKKGPLQFKTYLENAIEYLPFLLRFYSSTINFQSPAGKNEVVKKMVEQIKEWEEPLMVHEGIKKIAQICDVPLSIVQDDIPKVTPAFKSYINVNDLRFDPDKRLEMNLIRYMILSAHIDSKIYRFIMGNIKVGDLQVEVCRNLFQMIIAKIEKENKLDLIHFAIELDNIHLQEFFSEVMQKKGIDEKMEDAAKEVVKKILNRNWMMQREKIKNEIQSGRYSEEEVLSLAKQFDILKSAPPVIAKGD